jgi:hypothetical protein
MIAGNQEENAARSTKVAEFPLAWGLLFNT